MLNIKILGPGCANCERLEQLTVEALGMLGAEATLEHVRDRAEFAQYGLLYTPGLVVNGKLVSAGRIPSLPEITAFLTAALTQARQAA